MPYIGKSPELGVRTRYYYTVSAGATSVSGNDDNSKSLVFSDGEYVDVYLNGVSLVAGTDYNTTTANTIAGLSAMSANDVVEVIVYDVFSVFSGDVSGDLAVGGNLTGADGGALTVGVATTVTGALSAKGGVVFNEDSADVDFRVEGNGDANLLVCDAGSDFVAIGGTEQINSGKLTIATSAAGSALSFLTRSTTDAHQCEIIMQKSSTDSGNFAATADGESLGSIKFRGVNTSAVSDIGAEISVVQVGTASGTVPADMIFTTNETERFRIRSSGGIAIGGTGDANTLDDYEEGTWTPRITASTAGVATPTSDNGGTYVRVGDMVSLSFSIHWDAVTTAMNGSRRISGLPFTSADITGNFAGNFMGPHYNGMLQADHLNFMALPKNVNYIEVLSINSDGTNNASGHNYDHSGMSMPSAGNHTSMTMVYRAA